MVVGGAELFPRRGDVVGHRFRAADGGVLLQVVDSGRGGWLGGVQRGGGLVSRVMVVVMVVMMMVVVVMVVVAMVVMVEEARLAGAGVAGRHGVVIAGSTRCLRLAGAEGRVRGADRRVGGGGGRG